jgi:hypothetical protein
MADSGLDLDINNYSIQDLEKFFRFKKNQKYTAIDIELRESEIREQLLSSGHINKRFKRDLIEFLTLAKDWLIYTKCKPLNQPSIIPDNYKLDTIDTPLSKKEPTSREENIIKRPETEFTYVNTSEYFQGSLNPLNTRIITKCINIDTRFRQNLYKTEASDFVIQLPDKLSKVVSMQMSSLEFPICFYGISSFYGNNFFHIAIIFNDQNSITTTVVIPDGNYTSNEFIDAINNILCPVDITGEILNPTSPFSYIQFSQNITTTGSGTGTVTVNINKKTTYKTQYIKDVVSFTLDFSKDINGNEISELYDITTTKMSWNLGFQKPKYEGQISYTSETIIEPFAIRYVYLAIEDFNNSVNNLFLNAFSNITIDANVLARISLRANYFNLLMDTDLNIVTEPRKYFGPVDIQRLRIRVYDDHGRILNMNNSNFSFCLIFKMIYNI